jgi:hypothetical protein
MAELATALGVHPWHAPLEHSETGTYDTGGLLDNSGGICLIRRN